MQETAGVQHVSEFASSQHSITSFDDVSYWYNIFTFSTTASRPTLGPTHPPIHWVPGALTSG